MPDFKDEDALSSYSHMLFVQALAKAAILDWEGVGDEGGKPLPITDEAIEGLMRHHRLAESFIIAYAKPHIEVGLEGNA